MRVFIAILLIALMPLRVLAGDVMAIHKAVHAGPGTVTATMVHTECPGEHAAHTGTPTSDDSRHHTGGCDSCALCFTAALEWAALSVARLDIPNTAPPAPAAVYCSAALALGQKPPIS